VNVGDTVIVPPSITVTIDPTSFDPARGRGASTLLIVPSNYGPKPVVTVTGRIKFGGCTARRYLHGHGFFE